MKVTEIVRLEHVWGKIKTLVCEWDTAGTYTQRDLYLLDNILSYAMGDALRLPVISRVDSATTKRDIMSCIAVMDTVLNRVLSTNRLGSADRRYIATGFAILRWQLHSLFRATATPEQIVARYLATSH